MKKGLLYIVATPIGNLSDISQRAIDVLRGVSVIAAEDTRHSKKLLSHLGINQSLLSLHDHNERSRSGELIRMLDEGKDVAQVCDAGTPMISDPGFHLVRAAQEAGIRVIPVPGPSAVVSALSVSGLSANRFYFYGFLPERSEARKRALSSLLAVADTLVFYESGKRIQRCMADIQAVLDGQREAVICRELSKLHEEVRRSTVAELLSEIEDGTIDKRGEFVLLVAGNTGRVAEDDLLDTARSLLTEIGDHLPLGQAASIISRSLGCQRKSVYELGLQLKEKGS